METDIQLLEVVYSESIFTKLDWRFYCLVVCPLFWALFFWAIL